MKPGFAITLLLCSTAAGCVDDGEGAPMPPPAERTVQYHRDVQPIWDRWCVRCHNFHTPHLTAAESARELAGTSFRPCDGGTQKARLVVPSDPARSYLLFRLTMENTNDYDAVNCGRPMPADIRNGMGVPLAELDPAAVATIRTWIEEGASFD